MADRVKETAKEEVEYVKKLATEAARSGAYLYPVKGIMYFVTHRALWKPFLNKIIPVLTTGLSVTAFMFVFTYLPQAAVLAIFNGPLAALSTVLLVLSESSTIATLLSKSFFIQDALTDTFDGTLLERKEENLVGKGREIKPRGDAVGKLGRLIKQPFNKFAPKNIIRYFMYLPLNFIPVVGTVMFVLLQGKRFGPNAHARYFQLKGWNESEKRGYVNSKKAAYTGFGVPAVLLEMVPVAGLFFAFTNTVGAALWAADLEQQRSTAPRLQEQAKKAS